MTEAEWLESGEPDTLLAMSRFKELNRKSRLLAVACCRLISTQFVDERSHIAIEVAERYADRLATVDELEAAAWDAYDVHTEMYGVLGKLGSAIDWAASLAANGDAHLAARAVLSMSRFPRAYEKPTPPIELGSNRLTPCAVVRRSGLKAVVLGKWKVTIRCEVVPTGADKANQCEIIRDIFGNPFRPVTVDPDWLTPTVTALAQIMYDHRDFTPMPILADALQDAGCENEHLLDHCRGPGPHVRGCWVVDRVLGKE